MLEDSYKGDYYFNFMTKMFDKYSLETLEFWGGEPSYGLHRAIPTIRQALNYYPHLNRFFFSTNLATEKCVDDIINFWSIAKEFPEREFNFAIQLSLDGPLPINDFNRGEGVTKIFTKNFSKLLIRVQEFLNDVKNVNISAHFKPTLDNYAIGLL
jgi:sulfatase maturation enzyme AslB (radical SAM superfamily)